MQDEWLSVREVSEWLGWSRQGVRNLVREHKVQYRKLRCRGRKKWRISFNSLKRYVLDKLVTREELTRYERGKRKSKNSSEFTHKNQEAKACSTNRGEHDSDLACLPPDLIAPAEAVKRYQFSLGRFARMLSPNHLQLAEDLYQEMILSIYQCTKDATASWFLQHALNRGRHYARAERLRGMVSLDQIVEWAMRDEALRMDFELKLKVLRDDFQIPQKWIEEVIGMAMPEAV
jgi:hypothetical protein